VISASESHNKANIKRTIDESFEGLEKIRNEFKTLKIKLDIATAFGCPFEGKVPIENVLAMMERAYKMEIDGVCLCDTIGVANPVQVEEVLKAVREKYPDKEIGLHMHDTRGMGLANIVVALQNGLNLFESAAGGLGGCPFAPGAAGNIASEDLVNMLEEMGISTGIDLDKLVGVARLIREKIKPELTGHMVNVRNC
jgi:hydroxymethylglutaryl-CoA lyase